MTTLLARASNIRTSGPNKQKPINVASSTSRLIVSPSLPLKQSKQKTQMLHMAFGVTDTPLLVKNNHHRRRCGRLAGVVVRRLS